jgi:xanthine dehydrogenase accessory factor
MFDLSELQAAVAAKGRVVRVVVTQTAGSVPREVGAAMLVWQGGQAGTIGGGALEWQAAQAARGVLASGENRVDRLPLGPNIGQCCGGAVGLVTEVWDAAWLAAFQTGEGYVLRRVTGDAPKPLALARAEARARDRGVVAGLIFQNGWLFEPVARPSRQVWVWGAGHVGRAIVGVLAPLPDLAITWVDTMRDRFPDDTPHGVQVMVALDPGLAVGHAPAGAEHLILTYSHAIDLDLCHRLLSHGFGTCGLIGSASKWARFRSRLQALGHTPAQIARIQCPIGDPALGKHPQAIALGVGAALLRAPVSSRQEARA